MAVVTSCESREYLPVLRITCATSAPVFPKNEGALYKGSLHALLLFQFIHIQLIIQNGNQQTATKRRRT